MAKKKDKEVLKEVKQEPPKESTLYYFYSVGCGYCKKADPIVDELIADGHDILKLDLAEADNRGLKDEISKKYNKQCGTPWFIDAENGNQVCGYREKDVLEKWVNGEDIPAPPRPKSPPPKMPFHGATKKEENAWKKEYKKWAKENEHLPKIQDAEEILKRPRPKSDPPRPPAPNSTDEQYEEWGKKYDSWKSENGHLPNLQPTETILQRLKGQSQMVNQQGGPGAPGAPAGQLQNSAGVESRLNLVERKLDKLIAHLGVK